MPTTCSAACLAGASTHPGNFYTGVLARVSGAAPGGATSVKGELYLVDEPLLAALDEFEEHPTLFRAVGHPAGRRRDRPRPT